MTNERKNEAVAKVTKWAEWMISQSETGLAKIADIRYQAPSMGLGDLTRDEFDAVLRGVKLRRVAVTDYASFTDQELTDSLPGLGNEVHGYFAR